MQIRPLQPADLDLIDEIDSTIDSTHYLHVDRTGEGMSVSFRVEHRALPTPRRDANPIGDELRFSLKQIASSLDEGLAVIAEHDGVPIASVLARPSLSDATVVDLADVRVDFDHRREGLGSMLLFQAINFAREREARALRAEAKSSNAAYIALLVKLGFELTGLDTFRSTNHDLVKEQTTLVWYLALE